MLHCRSSRHPAARQIPLSPADQERFAQQLLDLAENDANPLIRADAESIEATVAIQTPILDVSTIEADAAARLDADLGGSPVVSCAEPRVVISPGREISCRVTADGGTAGPVDRPVVVTILDAEGNWELDLTP